MIYPLLLRFKALGDSVWPNISAKKTSNKGWSGPVFGALAVAPYNSSPLGPGARA
jgi:hypothetical protein